MRIWQLRRTTAESLRDFLKMSGFDFYERPHHLFMAKNDKLTVNMYNSGKLVFNDTPSEHITALESFLEQTDAVEVAKKAKSKPEPSNKLSEITETHIGTDESGKGDYFGPLVIGGVILGIFEAEELTERGIKDSKKLSDTRVKLLAKEIRKVIPLTQRKIVVISPGKYNQLHSKMKNLNTLMGWGHATVIENLLEQNTECKLAVVDKFGDVKHIEKLLGKYGQKITVIQEVRAEVDLAVAAASILARERFLFEIEALSKKYGLTFPKGAVNVIPTAVQFAKVHGGEALKLIAKYHFSTTGKVLSRI